MIRWMVAALALASAPATLAGQVPDSAKGRLTRDGVLRASAQVDSVFVDRKKPAGEIDTGDWASYLLARLGGGRIQDGLGIEVKADSSQIEVRGKLQDLPPETRALLGPLATMVDSSTVIAATITMQRTGREVVRFWLKALRVNGFPFPEFVLVPMMASVGRQYPALTATGRDLYLQVPADGKLSLGADLIYLSVSPGSGGSAGSPPDGRRP